MNNRFAAAKHPVVGVASFDPHAGFIGSDDLGLAQRCDGLVALSHEGPLRTPQHVHQTALADGEAEQVRKRTLHTLV